MPKPCAQALNWSAPKSFSHSPTGLDCAPKRDTKAGAASACVKFKPPRPASKNLRPTEGMASKTCTSTPAADNTSAARYVFGTQMVHPRDIPSIPHLGMVLAARAASIRTLRYLIASGADVNARTPVSDDISRDHSWLPFCTS